MRPKGGWEALVRDVLRDRLASAPAVNRAQLERRRELLLQIPFKAILTTNFDPALERTPGPLGPELYGKVLREERGRWWSAPGHEHQRPPVIKLHGDANGLDDDLPIVLGRADYRRLVYADRNYANFIRSVFAEYTVLFLGVSFTDAYLNELRSEVLNLVYPRGSRTPWGYAILNAPTPLFRSFLREDEGIETLPTTDHAQFEDWLEGIAARTSVEGRLATLLAGRRVVWVDMNPRNNELGRQFLSKTGAVEALSSPVELDVLSHHGADLIITSYGHVEAGRSRAFELLDLVGRWPTRPPVIVFAGDATAAQLAENRRQCLRRGAWEYATQWSELYGAIEVVLGRVPGTLAR